MITFVDVFRDLLVEILLKFRTMDFDLASAIKKLSLQNRVTFMDHVADFLFSLLPDEFFS
jgi:hypothetical protein